MTGKYLITTDNWFTAPDGNDYKAAWGNVQVLGDDMLGLKTNSRSTNWFAKLGSEENHIIIAGCQIHYAVKCNDKPNSGNSSSWNNNEGKVVISNNRPSVIYIAE